MRIRKSALLAIAFACVALPASASGHAERATQFPDPDYRDFPEYRTSGKQLVVCKDETKRIVNRYKGTLKHRNKKLLKECAFEHIQDAVNAASNGTRILVLPGTYHEEPSRRPAPAGCEGVYARTAAGDTRLTYAEQRRCPNAQNLVAVIGDTNNDRVCDSKCDIQIEGTGPTRESVRIGGDRAKLNVFRADRADGFVLRNMLIEFSDFNNVYVIETNGFRIGDIISRYSREYGILSFVSDHGIYENCETYGNGDSGVYPGSGPDRHGQPDAHGHTYGILIRGCDSHDNTIGYSGTAGNGIWAQGNRFHHNAAGVTTDSFASGHPGMPQDATKFSGNLIYSNNKDLFSSERDAYCKQPPAQRDPTVVCPTFQVPVGTGLLIAGGNDNVVEGNYIFDNWRRGTMQHWVPADARGETDQSKQFDTSANNSYRENCMSTRPADLADVDFASCTGTRDPNGVDFWWDENEGMDAETERGNCWSANKGPNGAPPTSDPPALPECPGSDAFQLGNLLKLFTLLPCSTWHPIRNTDPPGCDWFVVPNEPT